MRAGTGFVILLTATAVFVGPRLVPSSGRAAPPRPVSARDPVPPAIMQAKLQHSQQLLKHLVNDDLDAVRRSAEQLDRIGRNARWHDVQDDTVYSHFSLEFQRLSQKLGRMASEGNSEGAAYVYQQLTATCISCHQHVRNATRLRPADSR